MTGCKGLGIALTGWLLLGPISGKEMSLRHSLIKNEHLRLLHSFD
jgi:hypothetical protein